MRNHLLSFFLLLTIASFSANAGCNIGTLTTQASIDNFSITYSGCTEIDNGLYISGSNITNLNGLFAVTSATSLVIQDNPLLTNLTGLSQLVSAGDVNIENNGSLTSLSGLGKLTSVGQFRVVFNPVLTSVAGASKLTTINGFMSIGGSPLLENLSGLENITSIGDALAISLSDKLTNVDGLIGLKSLNGYLYIGNNLVLENLNGLTNLVTVIDYVNLENNAALTSLAGLDNMNMSAISYIKILGSPNLSMCGVKSICSFLTNSSNELIGGNASGCQTRQEILSSSACQSLPVELISFSGKNSDEGNKLSWTTTWELSNAGFGIEKSLNALKFDQIAFIDGAGTSNRSNTYSFTDTDPANITYYRLKQMDFDDTFSYSKMIVVKKDKINSSSTALSVYPNPSTGRFFIETNKENQKYSIQTSSGKTIKQGLLTAKKPVETSGMQNGLYLVKVGEEVSKVVVNN